MSTLKTVFLMTVCALVASAGAQAAPVPMFSTTLDDNASITGTGGTIVSPPAVYVPGVFANAFSGNGNRYGRWLDAQVGTIFSAWNDSLGFTVDLYFQGHWSTQSGDSGFWSIARRNGNMPSPPAPAGTPDDRYVIAGVKNKKLRLLFSGSGATDVNQYKYTLDGGTGAEAASNVSLADDIPYRLTMAQANGQFHVYVGGGAYGTFANPTLVFTATNLPVGYTWSMVPPGGVSPNKREMDAARRACFGGALQNGEWVDNIRVFNGFYTPAEIGVPEPFSLLLLGAGLPLLRRRRGA